MRINNNNKKTLTYFRGGHNSSHRLFTVLKGCFWKRSTSTAWLHLETSCRWECSVYKCFLMGITSNNTGHLAELGDERQWRTCSLTGPEFLGGRMKKAQVDPGEKSYKFRIEEVRKWHCFPLDPQCECCLHRGKQISKFFLISRRRSWRRSSQPEVVSGNQFFRTCCCWV